MGLAKAHPTVDTVLAGPSLLECLWGKNTPSLRTMQNYSYQLSRLESSSSFLNEELFPGGETAVDYFLSTSN